MINKFYYSLSKKEIINTIFISFILFVFINSYKENLSNSFLPLIITFFSFIIILNFKSDNNLSKMMIQDNKFKLINIKKFPNLNSDIEIVDIILELDNAPDINRYEFNKFVKYIDNFIKIIKESDKNTLQESEYYDLAYDESKKILNTLNSLIVSSQPVNLLKSKRKFNINYNNEIIKNISAKLEIIFSNYLKKIEIDNNNNWFKEDINIYSKPIYPNETKPLENSRYTKYNLY
tara:strand:- start:41 stop:742 length:702 start_codon:yes stop_codon:yes gene_type:complete